MLTALPSNNYNGNVPAYKNKKAQNKNSTYFKGKLKIGESILKYSEEKASDSAITVLISTVACMIFRPIIICWDLLMDKIRGKKSDDENTKSLNNQKSKSKDKDDDKKNAEDLKNQTIYAAVWQFGLAFFSLPIVTLFDKPIAKFSNVLSDKLLDSHVFKDSKGKIAKNKSIEKILKPNKKFSKKPAPITNKSQVNEILLSADKVFLPNEKLTLEILENDALVKKLKRVGEHFQKNKDYLSRKGRKKELEKQSAEVIKLIKDESIKKNFKDKKLQKKEGNLVHYLVENAEESAQKAEILKEVFKNPSSPETKNLIGKMAEVGGLSKVTKLITVLLACSAVTFAVTRYLGDILEKFGIKKPKSEEEDKPESSDKKSKYNSVDGIIFGTTAAAILLPLLHLATKKPDGSTVTKAFSKIGKLLNKGGIVKKAMNPISKQIQKQKTLLAQQLSHEADTKWLNRSVIFNMLFRVLVMLPTGQVYNTIRCVVDEFLTLTLLVAIDKSKIVEKAGKPIASALKSIGANKNKANAENPGVKFIGNQLIKNVGIVSIAMVFLNNWMSNHIIKLLPKKDKNENKDSSPNEKIEDKEKLYNTQRPILAERLRTDPEGFDSNQNFNDWYSSLKNSN